MTATIFLPCNAFETLALRVQSLFWPKPTFADDSFHPLEPPRHRRMVVRKIEVLGGVIGTKRIVDPSKVAMSSFCCLGLLAHASMYVWCVFWLNF